MIYCDAHFHIVQCISLDSSIEESFKMNINDDFFSCTCAHDIKELEAQEILCKNLSSSFVHFYGAFGMHPQSPTIENASFMEKLLESKRIQAIGETGFDLFTSDFKNNIKKQELAWDISLSLAKKYNVPIIIHNRKALDFMFRDIARLRELKGIIFHSFAFGEREALSLLRHNINAFFSFGKQILNGNKKSISCIKMLPMDRLLLETDAPFQTLKGELYTLPQDIKKVYSQAAFLRNVEESFLSERLKLTFLSIFNE